MEFFLFNDIRFDQTVNCGYYFIDSDEENGTLEETRNQTWVTNRDIRKDIFLSLPMTRSGFEKQNNSRHDQIRNKR